MRASAASQVRADSLLSAAVRSVVRHFRRHDGAALWVRCERSCARGSRFRLSRVDNETQERTPALNPLSDHRRVSATAAPQICFLLSSGTMGGCSIIKINAIRVPRESGDELAHRFAARAGAVDDADGFEGYELLKPTDDRDQWLVITRWRDEESFQAWLGSESFVQGHRSAAERQGGTTPKPVASHSEVWSYVVAGGSDFLLDRLPR